jgi:hypothetical protein
LGKLENTKDGLEVYVPGDHCEGSLKELIRYCKKDDNDYPHAKMELNKWKIVKSDLINLLLT